MKSTPQLRAQKVLKEALSSVKKLEKIARSREFSKSVEILSAREGKIILSGIGKSGFVGQKIAATLTSLGHPATFLHPVEAIHGDLGSVSYGDVVVAISYSGESPEMIKFLRCLRKDFDVAIVSICKSGSTSVGKLSDATISLGSLREGSPHNVAPMASTTATLVVGDALAAALTSPGEFKKDSFARFHPGGGLALSLKRVEDLMLGGAKVPLVDAESDLSEALSTISKKGLGIVGVKDKRSKLVGTITDGDIRRLLSRGGYKDDLKARGAMSKSPKFIESSASLKEALAKMEKEKITSLFVGTPESVVGIFHIHHILDS